MWTGQEPITYSDLRQADYLEEDSTIYRGALTVGWLSGTNGRKTLVLIFSQEPNDALS